MHREATQTAGEGQCEIGTAGVFRSLKTAVLYPIKNLGALGTVVFTTETRRIGMKIDLHFGLSNSVSEFSSTNALYPLLLSYDISAGTIVGQALLVRWLRQ